MLCLKCELTSNPRENQLHFCKCYGTLYGFFSYAMPHLYFNFLSGVNFGFVLNFGASG